MDIQKITDYRNKVIQNCEKIIVGKTDVIEKVLVCFLCSGHILLEDVPGTGKTMLLRAFSKSIGGSFKRIQFTPDLLPSDLTGINYFDRKSEDFIFRPGPIFANTVLADEINRATPRTQSSLLEAMAEKQVTVDGTTYPMAEPFMIMATQNPLESYGTFPLPEAQTDRFMMRLSLGYTDRNGEISILRGEDKGVLTEQLEAVVSLRETEEIKNEIRNVEVVPDVENYIMDIVSATRNDHRIRIGVSTRGAIALYKASQALAAISGRTYVVPEDVKELAPCILAHRITTAGTLKRTESEALIRELCENIAVPLEAAD